MDTRTRRAIGVQDPHKRLAALLDLLGEVESTRTEVLTARDETIRELHDDGVRIVDLVALTGLTRARVNQILGGTR
jgi:hypothetical protein